MLCMYFKYHPSTNIKKYGFGALKNLVFVDNYFGILPENGDVLYLFQICSCFCAGKGHTVMPPVTNIHGNSFSVKKNKLD